MDGNKATSKVKDWIFGALPVEDDEQNRALWHFNDATDSASFDELDWFAAFDRLELNTQQDTAQMATPPGPHPVSQPKVSQTTQRTMSDKRLAQDDMDVDQLLDELGITNDPNAHLSSLSLTSQHYQLTRESSDPHLSGDVDLHQLLDDMGVATDPVAQPVPSYMNAPYDRRMPTTPNSASTLVAPLVWLIGCLLLTLLLFVQYVVFNLDQLVKDPAYRTPLQQFCASINCALPDADLSEINISRQSFRASPIKANQTDVIAAMHNTGAQDQLYPNLKITFIKDGKIAGSLVAQPNDYLVTPQRMLGTSQVTLFMLTADIKYQNVTAVTIEPFY